jgi:hypothetical protein
MAVKVNGLAAWSDAHQALAENMASALQLLQDAPYSADPASPYQQAQAAAQALAGQGRELAVLGLGQIDAAIAGGPEMAQIAASAAQAKREADLLAKATKTVGKISAAVGSVSALVGKIAALPLV